MGSIRSRGSCSGDSARRPWGFIPGSCCSGPGGWCSFCSWWPAPRPLLMNTAGVQAMESDGRSGPGAPGVGSEILAGVDYGELRSLLRGFQVAGHLAEGSCQCPEHVPCDVAGGRTDQRQRRPGRGYPAARRSSHPAPLGIRPLSPRSAPPPGWRPRRRPARMLDAGQHPTSSPTSAH